jgi:hypothetical protein
VSNTESLCAVLDNKLARMLAGERVVLDDAALDVLEPDHEIRSIPNPEQVGTRDQWLCWIEA